MGGWHRWRLADSYQCVGGLQGGGYYLNSLFFYLSFCLLFSHALSHFLSEFYLFFILYCFFVYYLFSLSPVPLTRSYWGIETVVSVM